MDILVVGGLGYLGSIITNELHNQGNIVDVLDCALFDNEDVTNDINCRTLTIETTYNCNYNIVDYDIIVWCSDIDIGEYYNQELIEEAFFYKCLDNNPKMYYIGNFVSNINDYPYIAYKEFLSKRKEKVIESGGVYFDCGILYGPSPRMRWDTIINQMILIAYEGEVIPLHTDWLAKYPICNVFDAVKKIIKIIGLQQTVGRIPLCTRNVSLIEAAHLIVNCFTDKEIAVKTFPQETLGNDCELPIVDMKENVNIQDSVNHILKGLELNQLPDYEKDKYNNGIVISNMIEGMKAHNKLRGIL